MAGQNQEQISKAPGIIIPRDQIMSKISDCQGNGGSVPAIITPMNTELDQMSAATWLTHL